MAGQGGWPGVLLENLTDAAAARKEAERKEVGLGPELGYEFCPIIGYEFLPAAGKPVWLGVPGGGAWIWLSMTGVGFGSDLVCPEVGLGSGWV